MRAKCGLAGPNVRDPHSHIDSAYFLASTHTPARRAGKRKCRQATGQWRWTIPNRVSGVRENNKLGVFIEITIDVCMYVGHWDCLYEQL